MVMRAGTHDPLRAPREVLLVTDREAAELARRFPDGMTSAEIIRVIQHRGIKLSEGTFRKYVQQGLLPRSRRVGRKGKHKGSTGIYPSSAVIQIVAIKRMMAEGLTIEQIQRSWVRFRPRIESVEHDISELLDDLERELQEPHFETARRRKLSDELQQARADAVDLIQRFQQLEREVAWSPDRATTESDDEHEPEGEQAALGRFY